MVKNLQILTLVCFSGILFSQSDVTLKINHLINGKPLTVGTTTGINNSGENYRTDRLQYFVSEIVIQHDGGKSTSFPKLYLLVNGNKQVYTIGNGDITSIEKISFKIGVDAIANHSDPAAYPANHPLALSSPSMHWGWAAGYRFLALEGVCTTNGIEDMFQFHTIGNEMYTPIVVNNPPFTKTGQSIEILLDAEYNHLVDDLKLQGGLIQHGNLPPNPSIMKHFVDVFGAESVSTTSLNSDPVLSLNLLNNELLLNSNEMFQTVGLYTMAGIPVLSKDFGNGIQQTRIVTNDFQSGIYILKLAYKSGKSLTRSIALVK